MRYPLQPGESLQASKDAVAAMKEADGKSKAAAKALKAPSGNGTSARPWNLPNKR